MADQKNETAAAKADEPKKSEAAAPAKAAEHSAEKAVKAVPVAAAKAAPKARAAKAPKAAKPTRRAAPKAAKPATARKTTTRSNKTHEGTQTMKKEANQMADRVQAVFGDVNARAKTTFERNARVAEELTELSKGNVEAFVASTKVAARGVETLGQEVAELSRRSFEDASAALRSFVEVKSPTDLFRLQGEFVRGQFDSFVAESAKMSEAMIKLAGDVAQPLTNRYTVAAEKVKTAVAA